MNVKTFHALRFLSYVLRTREIITAFLCLTKETHSLKKKKFQEVEDLGKNLKSQLSISF